MQHTGGDLPEKKNKVKDDTHHDTLGYTDIIVHGGLLPHYKI
jgi:hypothetical protein